MTAAMYLEHYLDSLESLPKEIQKNFGQMRELDTQSIELNKEIDRLADEYLSRVRDLASDRKKEHLNNIQNLFNKSKKFGDEKVQLALQTYELVDRHIRRLDADLARFEVDIKEQPMSPVKISSSSKLNSSSSKSGSKVKDSKGKKRREKDASDCEIAKKKKKNKSEEPTGVSGSVPLALSLLPLGGSSHSSDVLDMPVDPNEPTYCTCHQVSYGEMIGCDNPDCPIEWFHFGCVGLTTKPKGKWFCSRCSVERKKKL